MPESSRKVSASTHHGRSGNPASRGTATAKPRPVRHQDRSWVPWVFIPVGLVGVLWLVVFYIIGDFVPFISGGWNVVVGMVLMAASFIIATLWK